MQVTPLRPIREILEPFGGTLPGALAPSESIRITRAMQSAGATPELIGETRGGCGGRFPIQRISDAGGDILVVEKNQQGSAEVAGSQFAGLIGIQHLVPLAVEHGQQGARMLRAAGTEAAQAGVKSADDLVALRMVALSREAPGLSVSERGRLARLEVELGQAMDYLLANSDRHTRNVMVDPERGAMALIDNGAIGDGDLFRPATTQAWRTPQLHRAFQPTEESAPLSPDTLQWLRDHIDDTTLTAWHQQHAAGLPRLKLDALLERWHHLTATGSIQRAPRLEKARNFVKPDFSKFLSQ